MKKLLLQDKVLWVIMLSFIVIFVIIEYGRYGDFGIYFDASNDLFKGENIYNNLYGDADIKLFPYQGNPLLTLLIHPLTLLPFNIATVIFKFLNISMLFRIWKLIQKYFDFSLLSVAKQNTWTVLVFVSIIFPIYSNFHSIQFTILLLYTFIEGLYCIKHKNYNLLGAFLLAIGIVVKISPFVVIPYLLYRGYFKAVMFIFFIVGLFFLVPIFFFGWDDNILLWSSWVDIVNHERDGGFDTGNRTNAGISALLSSLFMPELKNPYTSLSIRRHIVGLDPEVVIYIIHFFRLLFVTLMLYFLRTLPFKKERNKLHEIWEISYLLMVIPLIFPQQRPYNFIYLMPAISYCIYALFFSKTISISYKKIFFILAIVIINLELLLGSFREYYWYFRTITYGTLILLVILSLLNPLKLEKK